MNIKRTKASKLSRLIALLLAMFCGMVLAEAPKKLSVLIHAGTLLNIPGTPPLKQQSIVIEQGKVKAIVAGYQSPKDLGLSEASKVVDLRNQFVMPGFIDLHVHISSQYGDGGKLSKVTKSDAHFALTASAFAKSTLMAGFTTIRDLGSSGTSVFALRDVIKSGEIPGPKILVAGDAISATGGHGDFHGFRQEVLDALPKTGTCDGPDSCRAAVRRQVKRGADVIKVTVTGGVLSETAAGTGQQLTHEELEAIVDAAHSLGRKVTAHAHAKAGIEAAIRAGFDSIEHAMWADKETMKLFKKTGTWMIPTIYPITVVGDTPEKMAKGPFKNMPPPIMEKLLRLGKQPKEMTRLAHKMGVKIALGTDAGLFPHGDNANEFIEYVGVGMTEIEALMAGTINAAKAAGVDHKVGSIEPGKAADIVALPASPLDDIKQVLNVNFVMRDGIIFKSEH